MADEAVVVGLPVDAVVDAKDGASLAACWSLLMFLHLSWLTCCCGGGGGGGGGLVLDDVGGNDAESNVAGVLLRSPWASCCRAVSRR